MITGISAAGKAIPPHFQFRMTAQHEDNMQCQMEAAAFFPNIHGKFGMDKPRYLGLSVGLNEKGGMVNEEFDNYIRNSILPLFPDACNMPGKRIMIKFVSSPGRLNVDLLAELKLMGWYMYPVVPNTTSVKQETNQNYGPFKGQFWSKLGDLVDARIKAKKCLFAAMVGWAHCFWWNGWGDWVQHYTVCILGWLLKRSMFEHVGKGWCGAMHSEVVVGLLAPSQRYSTI